jgi:hypothetical protein
MKTYRAGTVLILAACLAACGGEESRWAGTMSDSAGVTIVSNTDVGIWGPGEGWALEEELRIGAVEGAPEYQFGQVSRIAVDSKGRIFVLDGQAQHIQVYSPDGTHEQTVGARGLVADFENVWLAGGGSAEAVKFGPLLGEYIARRVLGVEDDPELAEQFRLKEEEFEDEEEETGRNQS